MSVLTLSICFSDKLISLLYRYQNFAPKFEGRYLSSNVNITVVDKDGKPMSVPVGSAYNSSPLYTNPNMEIFRPFC